MRFWGGFVLPAVLVVACVIIVSHVLNLDPVSSRPVEGGQSRLEGLSPSAAFRSAFYRMEVYRSPAPFARDAVFLDPRGDRVQIEDFAGKPVLVMLWASWCSVCVRGLPEFEKLAAFLEGAGDGRTPSVIAISVDTQKDQKDIRAFLRGRQIGDFALYHDDNKEVNRIIAPRGLPATYLLDDRGRAVMRFEGGADWNHPYVRSYFERIWSQ